MNTFITVSPLLVVQRKEKSRSIRKGICNYRALNADLIDRTWKIPIVHSSEAHLQQSDGHSSGRAVGSGWDGLANAHSVPNQFLVYQKYRKSHTLYNAILRIARNFLETRENIKISTHPFYHINLG